jgi:hypothetical protein
MKKMYFFLILAGNLLALAPCSIAQMEKVTSKTATADKGYKVVNPGEAVVTIYQYVHYAHSPKEADKYAHKYFFSTSASDVLLPLTKANLKNAFPTNHPFHDALDANFREDKELVNYDDFHKMYKINWLLKNHS